jgi:hypothetical protein
MKLKAEDCRAIKIRLNYKKVINVNRFISFFGIAEKLILIMIFTDLIHDLDRFQKLKGNPPQKNRANQRLVIIQK